MWIKPLVQALAVLGIAGFAAAQPPTVNVDDSNPPFMYAKNGKPAGIYPAIIEAAFKRMNVPVALQAEPWKRAIQDLDAGTAGVGGIYKTPERERKYDFSEPIYSEKLMVYSSRKNPVNFTRLDDLKGKRVGTIRGWSYGDEFDGARKANAFTVDETASDTQNFMKLDQGRVDAVVAISEAGNALLAKYKTIAAAAVPLTQNPTYLAFAKSANQGALLRQFNEAVDAMKKSGDLHKAVQEGLEK